MYPPTTPKTHISLSPISSYILAWSNSGIPIQPEEYTIYPRRDAIRDMDMAELIRLTEEAGAEFARTVGKETYYDLSEAEKRRFMTSTRVSAAGSSSTVAKTTIELDDEYWYRHLPQISRARTKTTATMSANDLISHAYDLLALALVAGDMAADVRQELRNLESQRRTDTSIDVSKELTELCGSLEQTLQPYDFVSTYVPDEANSARVQDTQSRAGYGCK